MLKKSVLGFRIFLFFFLVNHLFIILKTNIVISTLLFSKIL